MHGNELWISDGTEEGTMMTADIWPRSNEPSDPGAFAEIGEPISETSLFQLYPNPAHSSIILEPVTTTEIHYRILDISGREVMNGSVRDGSKTQLDLSSLRSGLYLIRGEAGHASQTVKFTVE
ncbi:MAG: T9SS type A sorting domain-containing protein [Bacteroidota bacterium]|nr:T9SS type A sorting domain-containing protein [Bacteroidota bacterium]